MGEARTTHSRLRRCCSHRTSCRSRKRVVTRTRCHSVCCLHQSHRNRAGDQHVERVCKNREEVRALCPCPQHSVHHQVEIDEVRSWRNMYSRHNICRNEDSNHWPQYLHEVINTTSDVEIKHIVPQRLRGKEPSSAVNRGCFARHSGTDHHINRIDHCFGIEHNFAGGNLQKFVIDIQFFHHIVIKFNDK